MSRRVAIQSAPQELFLNYLPLRFTSDVFTGGILVFDETGDPHDKDSPIAKSLRDLRAAHSDTHLFYRSGNKIYSVPLVAGQHAHGTATTFHMLGDFQLAN